MCVSLTYKDIIQGKNMLFSSIPFLYYFLPVVLLLYFCVPRKGKNVVLLLASLFFYAWGEPKYILLMVTAIVSGYAFAFLIERFRGTGWSKVFCVMSVTVSLAMLMFFKYADFFISNFNTATGLSVPLLKIALPIGISFYTFQILGYTIDVYRGKTGAQRNIIQFGTYVAMFPQLIAGPIVRYTDLEKQLSERSHSFDRTALGIRRFLVGLGKKILIANSLGELCEIFRASNDKSVLFYWLYALATSLHIYFDFSGYSDMAIGLGKIFGFDLMENFNYPFISGSITEFWRRWHISLGTWFRDYVYIPLGGNRVSKAKWFRNILIVWFLTGFWHGAAWNFIVWGLFFAMLLIVEKFFLLPYLEKGKLVNHIYVCFLLLVSFVLFNAEDVGEAVRYIAAMFGAGGIPVVSAEFLYYLRSYAVLLILAVAGATPLMKKAVAFLCKKKRGEVLVNLLEPMVSVILLLVITAYLVDGSFNPFLYFRF